jgi:hypothetical protein
VGCAPVSYDDRVGERRVTRRMARRPEPSKPTRQSQWPAAGSEPCATVRMYAWSKWRPGPQTPGPLGGTRCPGAKPAEIARLPSTFSATLWGPPMVQDRPMTKRAWRPGGAPDARRLTGGTKCARRCGVYRAVPPRRQAMPQTMISFREHQHRRR